MVAALQRPLGGAGGGGPAGGRRVGTKRRSDRIRSEPALRARRTGVRTDGGGGHQRVHAGEPGAAGGGGGRPLTALPAPGRSELSGRPGGGGGAGRIGPAGTRGRVRRGVERALPDPPAKRRAQPGRDGARAGLRRAGRFDPGGRPGDRPGAVCVRCAGDRRERRRVPGGHGGGLPQRLHAGAAAGDRDRAHPGAGAGHRAGGTRGRPLPAGTRPRLPVLEPARRRSGRRRRLPQPGDPGGGRLRDDGHADAADRAGEAPGRYRGGRAGHSPVGRDHGLHLQRPALRGRGARAAQRPPAGGVQRARVRRFLPLRPQPGALPHRRRREYGPTRPLAHPGLRTRTHRQEGPLPGKRLRASVVFGAASRQTSRSAVLRRCRPGGDSDRARRGANRARTWHPGRAAGRTGSRRGAASRCRPDPSPGGRRSHRHAR